MEISTQWFRKNFTLPDYRHFLEEPYRTIISGNAPGAYIKRIALSLATDLGTFDYAKFSEATHCKDFSAGFGL